MTLETQLPPAPPYQDPAELAGRPMTEYVYLVALLIAAAADYVAFKQILSLLLSELSGAEIVMAVVGVTACALTLAHFAGQMYRDHTHGFGRHRRWLLVAMVVAWAALGIAALVVRLMVASSTHSAFTPPNSIPQDDRLTGGALLFLILYIASGLLTGVGAYHTHQPIRTRYRKASSEYQKARRKLGDSHGVHERAVAKLQVQVGNRQREEHNHTAARKLRESVAAELRAYARLQMAGHLQDPSATTGLTGRTRPRPASPS